MRTISYQNEAWRPPEPVLPLAVISCAGPSPPDAGLETEILRQRVAGPQWIDEVRAAPIARRRTLVYSKTPDRKVFMIDGRVMEEDRIDQAAKLGDTEEWTVVNTDQQYHSFHIHQTPFLVTEVGGARWNDDSLRDTFSVPPATDQGSGHAEGGHSLHRSGNRRALCLSLSRGRSRRQRHDGRDRGRRLDFALEHDLFRKPASTFRDHALKQVARRPSRCARLSLFIAR